MSLASGVSLAAGLDGGVDAAVAAVIAAGRAAAARHWVPATSGNFSVRIASTHAAITRSGADKGALSTKDVLVQALNQPLQTGSSAEAALHIRLYRDDPGIGAIFHVHSPYASALSRHYAEQGTLELSGWELQKALSGVTTHEMVVEVPVFENSQDIAALASIVAARLAAPVTEGRVRAPGYLLAGHGLYAWGAAPADAARHLEALEVLFHQTIIAGTCQP